MNSSRHRWSLGLLVVQAMLVVKVCSTFDCRRQSITCANSGTCGSNGQCTGCPGFQGYDCQLPSADIGNNDCSGSNHCHNSAVCYDDTLDGDNTMVNCHCQSQHTGPQCLEARYTVLCTDTDMTVSITPYSASSVVYQKDKQRTCDLTESSGTWTRTGMLHAGDTSCGSADIDLSATTTTFIRKFIVQDLSDKVTDADFIVTAVCSQGTVIGTATTSKLDVIQYVGEIKIQSEVGDVTLSSILPGGAVRTIGDVVTFTFTANADLEEIRLDSVVASDNLLGSSTYMLISTGCRNPGSKAIVVTNPGHPGTDKKVIEVKLAIFLFNSNPSLKFSFTFSTCLAGDSVNCAPVMCSSKRKRDVSRSLFSNKPNVIEVIFITNEDLKSNKGSSDGNRHCSDCNDVILPVVTAGASLFIGVMFVCLVLVFVKRWRNGRKFTTDRNSTRATA